MTLSKEPYNRYDRTHRRVFDFTTDPWRDEVLQAIRKWYGR